MNIEKDIPLPMNIEKDIPLPIKHSSRARIILSMDIGDSVFIPGADLANNDITNERARWGSAAKSKGRSVATRRVDGGLRVWRSA